MGMKKSIQAIKKRIAQRIFFCHNTVMRRFLTDHDGYECQEDNGSFMIAFQSPRNACLWAIATHIAFLKMDWSKEPKLVADILKIVHTDLKIGIHTGIPESVSPHVTTGRADYFGDFVNKTARIAGCTEGGQVMLSEAAYLNLGPNHKLPVTVCPEKVALKGIQDKVQLYGLNVPDRPSCSATDFPGCKYAQFTLDGAHSRDEVLSLSFKNRKSGAGVLLTLALALNLNLNLALNFNFNLNLALNLALFLAPRFCQGRTWERSPVGSGYSGHGHCGHV
jgi:hypothetical protein